MTIQNPNTRFNSRWIGETQGCEMPAATADPGRLVRRPTAESKTVAPQRTQRAQRTQRSFSHRCVLCARCYKARQRRFISAAPLNANPVRRLSRKRCAFRQPNSAPAWREAYKYQELAHQGLRERSVAGVLERS